MLPTFPRRYGLVVLTAILLVKAPNNSHAHKLRRRSKGGTNSKSSTLAASNLDIEGEGGGFKVVGGPIHHSSTKYERRRSTMLREEEMELEDVVEANEFVHGESLVSVSFTIDLQ